MTQPNPLPIRLAQTLGLSSTLLFGGANLAISILLVPRLLETPSPPLLLQQWLRTYTLGKNIARPTALLSALCYLYLAYISHGASSRALLVTGPSQPPWQRTWKVYSYVASAVLVLGIVPYTLLVMGRTNARLMQKESEVRGLKLAETSVQVALAGEEESAHSLVDWWGVLNLGRGAMVTVSGVLALWTALS